MMSDNSNAHYLFVTGRLAATAVNDVVPKVAADVGFRYSIEVLPISVAALMTPRWIGRHLTIDKQVTHVVLPGHCEGDLSMLAENHRGDLDWLVGPKDIRRLAAWFGKNTEKTELSQHDLEIIAEINHATRKPVDEVVSMASSLIDDGADRIDIGGDPQNPCQNIGDYVRAVLSLGIPVSIDSFDVDEVLAATKAGANLVLSVNQSNLHAAEDFGCEVVVIPDVPNDENSLEKNINFLRDRDISFRIDPILEPIGSGFAASIVRYGTARQNYPDAAMMMGIGNLSELTDVDSAGVNMLLVGICAEWKIQSVLTTQVINWARTSVCEIDHARRAAFHSIKHGVPPKNLSDELVILRDKKLEGYSEETLSLWADQIRDNNYRIFETKRGLRIISAHVDLCDEDPFRLFESLMKLPQSDNVDAGHAFYLGYELAKANLARQLGKNYEQDRALNWGFLTKAEDHHRIERTSRHRKGK